jgi:hypothetical protein
MSSLAPATTRHDEQRGLWARFLDGVLPHPDPDHLVPVAEVVRAAVPLVEECLSDAQLPSLIHEISGRWGAESRFQVLVPARQAKAAAELVRGI